MDKCRIWNTWSIWCKDLPDKMYVGQWPTFHGTGICLIFWRLFDGLMLYWRYWFSVTQTLNWNYIWPIFHDPVILLYILKDYLMDKYHSWNIVSYMIRDVYLDLFRISIYSLQLCILCQISWFSARLAKDRSIWVMTGSVVNTGFNRSILVDWSIEISVVR